MPTKPKATASSSPPADRILDILASLAVGEIETAAAAALAGMDEATFIGFVEDHPHLLDQAEEKARQLRQSPERTIERSTSGLAGAVEVLAARIERDGATMLTSELVAASQLMEKILGISESRKQEIRSQTDASQSDQAKLPIVVQDTRPNPITQAARLCVFVIPPGEFGWVDFSKPEFQAGQFDWCEAFAPLSPIDGECLSESIRLLLQGGGRYMDSTGRIIEA